MNLERINRHHNRTLRKVMYQLKRQYGSGPVDIYQMVSEGTNLQTGIKTRVADVTRVRRAVVLPEKLEKHVERSISVISADKQSVFGGYYNTGSTIFMIEQKDVPDLLLTTEDWLIHDCVKYNVEHFDEFEFGSLWVISARRILVDTFETIHLASADDFFAPVEVSSYA